MNQLERKSYIIDFSREEEALGLPLQVQGTGCVLGPVLGMGQAVLRQTLFLPFLNLESGGGDRHSLDKWLEAGAQVCVI